MIDFRLGDDARKTGAVLLKALSMAASCSVGVLTSSAFNPKPSATRAGRPGVKSTEKYLPWLCSFCKALIHPKVLLLK